MVELLFENAHLLIRCKVQFSELGLMLDESLYISVEFFLFGKM